MTEDEFLKLYSNLIMEEESIIKTELIKKKRNLEIITRDDKSRYIDDHDDETHFY